MMTDHSLFLLMTILLSGRPDCCDAFASYLISDSNCWTELATDEVIMNHPVVAAADSDDPEMQIMVANIDDDTSDALAVVNGQIAVPGFPATVPLRVATSADSKTDPDYQWAMDILDGSGTFVDGGCEAKNRVAGQGAKEFVQVVVEQAGATVVAAWATSHEAVRLTPVVEFVLSSEEGNPETGPEDPVRLEEYRAKVEMDEKDKDGNPETGPEVLSEDIQLLKEYVKEKREMQQIKDSNKDPQKKLDELMRNSVDGLKAQIERHKKERRERNQVSSNDAKLTSDDSRYKKHFEAQKRAAKDRIKRHRQSDKVYFQNGKAKKKHLLQYEIGFDMHERLSMGSYFQGATLMIVGTAGLIHFCLWASRRGSKGRLDL